MDATASTERRRYWGSIAALFVVLPAAFLVHTWESLTQWYEGRDRAPIMLEQGVSPPYAGLRWRLQQLRHLPGPSSRAAVVLAEFEAEVASTPVNVNGLCRVRLTDALGRLWQATFTLDRVATKTHPEVANRPNCAGPTFGGARPGDKIAMAATFLIPKDARDLALRIDIAEAAPDSLLLRWKQP